LCLLKRATGPLMTTGGSAVADGDAGWSEQEGALPDALHLAIEGADGASHEIHDALCFLWGDVIQLEQHAMALADYFHSVLGVTNLEPLIDVHEIGGSPV
jgi:hypothetical protein